MIITVDDMVIIEGDLQHVGERHVRPVWLGSIFLVVCTMGIAFLILNGNVRWLIIFTGACYLLGVQGITIFIHLPLNDRIQNVKVDEVEDEPVHQQRLIFEAKWNFFNRVRTAFGFCATSMFLFAVSVT